MRQARLGWRPAVALAALCLLAACSATFRNHGYMPPDEDLQGIIVGVDTRDTVASAIGRPGVAGIVDESGWYYIRSRYRNFAFYEPEEVDRQVLAISFDNAGTVSNIERFGLERGRVVSIERRVTTSNTQGISLLQQAFGNLGRFDPGDFLGGDGG